MYEELLGTLRQNGIALKTVRQREDGSGDVAGSHTSRSPGVSPNRLDVSKIVSSLIEQDLKEQRRRLPVVEGTPDRSRSSPHGPDQVAHRVPGEAIPAQIHSPRACLATEIRLHQQ